MVDVISTRLQEVYGSIRLPGFPGGGNNDEIPQERLTTSALKRFGEEGRRKNAFNKEIERKVR